MLFLKMGAAEWTPVGNESLYAVVPGKQGTAALVLCDMDGNSKVMSDWVASGQAEEYSRSLSAKGLQRFDGEVKLPI